MSDWVAGATLRPLAFNINMVPGSGLVQGAVVTYEVVLPSGRVCGPFQRNLDLGQVQATIDASASAIVGQLLVVEGLQSIWSPPP